MLEFFRTYDFLNQGSEYRLRVTDQPSILDFDKKSNKKLDSVEFVRGVDGESLVKLYHIAVYAKESTSYSLVAHEEKPGKKTMIQLYPGYPLKRTLFTMPIFETTDCITSRSVIPKIQSRTSRSPSHPLQDPSIYTQRIRPQQWTGKPIILGMTGYTCLTPPALISPSTSRLLTQNTFWNLLT